jgi:hypothetical protein
MGGIMPEHSKLPANANSLVFVGSSGKAVFVQWLVNADDWMDTSFSDFNPLEECDYDACEGLWFTEFKGSYCCGPICKCDARDCFETDFELVGLVGNSEFIVKACNEHDSLKAKAGLLDEAIMLLRSSYRGYRLDSEDHFRITELIKELK